MQMNECFANHPFSFLNGLILSALAGLLTLGCQSWQAQEPSPLSTTESTAKQTPGVRNLFAGADLDAWREPTGSWMTAAEVKPSPDDPAKFAITPGQGILVNGKEGNTVNLLSKYEHGDVRAHIEFMVPKGSNSGIYFQGRYEIQVFDSWGVADPSYSDAGGIYQRWEDGQGFDGHAPRINASLRPGEWQTFDVLFRAPKFDENGTKTQDARFEKVVHNGVTIHEEDSLSGPTRAAAYQDEAPQGPLMLQGDHGPVAYRNLWIQQLR